MKRKENESPQHKEVDNWQMTNNNEKMYTKINAVQTSLQSDEQEVVEEAN